MRDTSGEVTSVNVDAPPSSDLTVSGRKEAPPRRGSRWWGLIGVAPIVPLLVERIQILTRRHPTGADETLYLMMALNWLGRITKQSTDAHRTRGLPALLYPAARFTDATWVYRLEMVLLSLGLYVLVYLIGRRFMSRVAAAWAALLLCLFNTTLLSSVALLPDLPAAVAIAWAFLFYWRRVVGASPGERLRGLWLVALGIAAAFYFNIAFAAFAGLAFSLDFVLFRRRDLFSRAILEALAALGLLVGPYFIRVWMDHGTPFYTLRKGLSGTPDAVPGYVSYTRYFWHDLGRFWGLAVIAGVAILAYSLVRGTVIPRRHAALLAIWLVVPTLLTAYVFHAENRYMVPWLPAAFLCLALPVEAFIRAGAKLPQRGAVRLAAWGSLLSLLISGAAWFGVWQYKPVAARADASAKNFTFVHYTATLLGERLANPPCRAYGRYPRELELHTGCITSYWQTRTPERVLEEAHEYPDQTWFVWWSGLGTNTPRQPAWLIGFFKKHAVLKFTVPGNRRFGTAYVYQYRETSAEP